MRKFTVSEPPVGDELTAIVTAFQGLFDTPGAALVAVSIMLPIMMAGGGFTEENAADYMRLVLDKHRDFMAMLEGIKNEEVH